MRPSLHSLFEIQKVPVGTRGRIWSEGGRLIRDWTTTGSATWDGRDSQGIGDYVKKGETKRVRFVLER